MSKIHETSAFHTNASIIARRSVAIRDALIFERDEVRELGLGHVVIGVGKADEFLDLVAEDLTCLRRCATRRNRPGC